MPTPTTPSAASGAAHYRGGTDLFDIAGRRALVTGASRGIGYALARGLLAAGCPVVINGRDEHTLATAAEQLRRDTGGTVYPVPFDVADPDAVAAGVGRAEELAGPLDILVNNAGTQHRVPLHEFPDSAWYRLLDTNLTSAFLVGRAVARGMMARGYGKIVNICSLQSESARAGTAPYAATKGGLKLLTRGMCADWARYGIQVNGIGPGYIETELTRPSSTRGYASAPRPAAGAPLWTSSGRCATWWRRRATSSTGRSCTSTAGCSRCCEAVAS
jgi:gluconate 5-dehydrogenase